MPRHKQKPILLFCLVVVALGCAKTYRTATPTTPKFFKQTFAAEPNSIYYALRWAFKTNGYPIAEEDLKGGVLKTRYVPVRAKSHYVDVFGHKDFGVSGAYHQLEVRLVPKGSKTEVQIGSRIQAALSPIKSAGQEEAMLLQKISEYLRGPTFQITNQGAQE